MFFYLLLILIVIIILIPDGRTTSNFMQSRLAKGILIQTDTIAKYLVS